MPSGGQRIKEFDVVDGLVQVRVVLGVGAVGDHDAHGYGDGIEQLAHGIHQDRQELAEGKALQVRNGVDQEALPARAGDARGRVGAAQGQGVDGHDDDEHEEDRHQDFGIAFNALFDTVVDDEARSQDEEEEPEDRFPLARDEGAEVFAAGRRLRAAGQERPQVFQHPAADDAVVRQDQDRYEAGQKARPAEAVVQLGRRRQGTLAGAAAKGDFRRQQRVAEGRHQQQVADQEKAAAVTGRQEGETPDVAQPDGTAGRRHHEPEGSGKTIAFVIIHCTRTSNRLPFPTSALLCLYGVRCAETHILHYTGFSEIVHLFAIFLANLDRNPQKVCLEGSYVRTRCIFKTVRKGNIWYPGLCRSPERCGGPPSA